MRHKLSIVNICRPCSEIMRTCVYIYAIRSQRVNLTQLRQKTRTRRDKKSGRKAPRHGDYEVVPAPDAKSLVCCCCVI